MSAGAVTVSRTDGQKDTYEVEDTGATRLQDNGALIVATSSGAASMYAPGQWVRVYVEVDQ